MQYALKRALKISIYGMLALATFVVAFLLGGNRHQNTSTEIGPSAAYADVPYAEASYGGSEGVAGSGGSEGSGEGSEGSEGS